MLWIKRIQSLVRRRESERELNDELQHHIELRTQENIEAGMSPDRHFCAYGLYGLTIDARNRNPHGAGRAETRRTPSHAGQRYGARGYGRGDRHSRRLRSDQVFVQLALWRQTYRPSDVCSRPTRLGKCRAGRVLSSGAASHESRRDSGAASRIGVRSRVLGGQEQ
jgi:hypothetical protein